MTSCVVCDLGAGSGRVMLARCEADGMRMEEVHRFDGYAVERDDGPHWDLSRIVSEVVSGLRRAHALAGSLDSVGIDSWGLDYALLDAAGTVTEEPFHYRHPRAQRGVAQCPVPPAQLFAMTGSQILPVNTLYQLADEARAMPTRHQTARRLLMIADAVCHHLTGVARAELTLARTSGLVEAGSDRWSLDLCTGIGLDPRLLPPILHPGQIYGRLRPEIGLGPVPVVAVAAHDTASAVAALPLTTETGFLILGSWSLVGAETDDFDRRPEVLAAGFGNEGGVTGRTFLVRSLNGLHLIQKLRDSLWRRGMDVSFAELARQAAAAPDGAAINPSDPRFQSPADVIEAVAATCGRATADDPGACARAIYRGLATEAALAAAALERLLGRSLAALRVCGGGAQDPLLCALIAAATGKPLAIGPVEATAWGNAILQLLGLGRISTLDAGRRLVERSTRRTHVTAPVAHAGN